MSIDRETAIQLETNELKHQIDKLLGEDCYPASISYEIERLIELKIAEQFLKISKEL